jgi:hypothetical protein
MNRGELQLDRSGGIPRNLVWGKRLSGSYDGEAEEEQLDERKCISKPGFFFTAPRKENEKKKRDRERGREKKRKKVSD